MEDDVELVWKMRLGYHKPRLFLFHSASLPIFPYF